MDLINMDMSAKYFIVDKYFEKVMEENKLNKGLYFVELAIAKAECKKRIGHFDLNAFKLYFLFREIFNINIKFIVEMGGQIAAYDHLLTLINEDKHFVDRLVSNAIPVVVFPEGTVIQ